MHSSPCYFFFFPFPFLLLVLSVKTTPALKKTKGLYFLETYFAKWLYKIEYLHHIKLIMAALSSGELNINGTGIG